MRNFVGIEFELNVSMARRKILQSYEDPYQLTSIDNNKEWFYIGKSLCWSIFWSNLNKATDFFQLQIMAFILMDKYYHLISKIIIDHTLCSIIRCFIASINQEINKKAKKNNHVFGGPYNASLITNQIHYAHLLKYVFRNPVMAGIGKNV